MIARVAGTWPGAVVARIFLIGITTIAVAALTAPRAWAQSGLVAAYSFDEGSGNSVKDSSAGGNNGTLANTAWTPQGRYGSALTFNGSSALVTVPSSSSLRLTSAMTLEAWVRPTAVSAQWRDVIYKGNDNYFLEATSDRASRPATGASIGRNVYGPSPIAVNTWTHLAATYDGSTLKLYVNGAVVGSGARSGALETSGNPLQIGGDSMFGQYFAGTIDEVRVYNVALTDAQVRADMTTPIGPAGTAPTPPPPADLTISKTHVGSFTQGQTGATYTLLVKNNGSGATTGTVTVRDTLPGGLTAAGMSGSGWNCTTSTLTCTRSDALAGGGSYPSVTVTVNVSASAPSSVTNTATVSGGGENNAGNDSASDVTAIASVVSPLPLPAPTPGSGLVAAYSFDEGSGGTIQDSSANNNDGTISNATWTTGRFGGALAFNGTNALVSVPSSQSLLLTTALTLEAWVRPTTVSAQWRDVIYKGNDNYFLEGTSDSSSRPATGGTFAPGNVYGSSAIGVNTWTHLASTYDGSTLKLYVNGTMVSSGSRSGVIATSSNPLQIGGDSIFGQHFAGTIDEVRVYDVALTAAQIQSDMTTPIGSPAAVTPAPGTGTADTLAPTAALSSPVNGAQVSGILTVTANASDNVGVTSVTFLVDGTPIGSDTSAPYSISWNTAAFPAGPHSMQAQARDAAGNVGTSPTVNVNIAAPANTPSPATATFTPSPDDAMVSRYTLDIFWSGENPNTATPTASANLGKPPMVNGEYSADISATLASLPVGTFVATVSAEAAAGKARSAPSPTFTITSSTVTSVRRPDIAITSAMPAMSNAATAGTLWVTNASTHMVTAIDATTGDVLATVPVGTRPVAVVAPSGSARIYVADEESDTVSIVDKATMTRVAAISLPAPFGRKPHRLAGSADGSRLFVSERGSNVVDVIDVSIDQVVMRFAAGQPGSRILTAIPDSGGQLVYALSRADDASQSELAAIETATGRWVWSIPIAEQVGDLTLEPDGRTALVSVPAKNAVLVIDLERRVSMGAIDFGTGNAPDALRPSADGHVVVTLQASHERVGIIDPAAKVRVVSLAAVSAGRSERFDARLLSYITLSYITLRDEPGVVGVDPASGNVVRRYRLPGGGGASDVTFDPK